MTMKRILVLLGFPSVVEHQGKCNDISRSQEGDSYSNIRHYCFSCKSYFLEQCSWAIKKLIDFILLINVNLENGSLNYFFLPVPYCA